MRAAVYSLRLFETNEKQVQKKTTARVSLSNDACTCMCVRGAAAVPAHMSTHFGGVCNTSHDSSKTQTSTEGEKTNKQRKGLNLELLKLSVSPES